MPYRSDIDGLRAIAVVSVVLFHLGIGGFSGGYIGVDVFFVVSGYLITSILLNDIRRDRFSIVNFYERRIRRIFPALLFMIAFAGIAAAILFLPSALNDFSKSVVATALFVSNVMFWRDTGYFAEPAELKPLIHTWSLAVEEQFYLFYPLLLWAIIRISTRRWPLIILALLIFSLMSSSWAVSRYPTAAFYIGPFRAWELYLGALLASGAVPSVTQRYQRELIAGLGLALILWGVVTFDSRTPIPGLHALAPCLGAALLIHSGSLASPTLVAHLLMLRPVVFVGLISYSLYLWHWPVIVYTRYWSLSEPGPWLMTAMVGLSFLAATFSWKYIEMPFRRKTALPSRRSLFMAAGSATAAICLFGILGDASNGWPGRMEQAVLQANKVLKQSHQSQRLCHHASKRKLEELCIRGVENAPPDFILLGDSKAGAVSETVFIAAKTVDRSGFQFTDGGYLPLFGYILVEGRLERYTLNVRLRVLLESNRIKDVIIVGGWDRVLQQKFIRKDKAVVDGQEALQEGLAELARSFPGIDFTIVEDHPNGESLSAELALRAMHLRRPAPEGLAREEYVKQLERLRPMFDFLDALPNIDIDSPAEFLCQPNWCPSSADGEPLYRNRNHLALAGSRRLEALYEELLHE